MNIDEAIEKVNASLLLGEEYIQGDDLILQGAPTKDNDRIFYWKEDRKSCPREGIILGTLKALRTHYVYDRHNKTLNVIDHSFLAKRVKL